MQEDNTNFYHGHIQQNITRLDERKDKFIGHRLDFLREFCQPIQRKIEQTRKEIEKERHTLEHIADIIEEDPDITRIREQVEQYTNTNNYFGQKVQEYQDRRVEVEEYNGQIKKQIRKIEASVYQQQPIMTLPSLPRPQPQARKRATTQNIQHNTSLPPISSQPTTQPTTTRPNKRIIPIGEKIQKSRRQNTAQNQVLSQSEKLEPESQKPSPAQAGSKKAPRSQIAQFNKTQVLFRECFEAKKASIQKSVSQLQPKLITNRDQFLMTCQALGGNSKPVTVDTFLALTPDEIVTLFISFVWLNRRLYGQLAAKRKHIVQLMRRMKSKP